MINDSLSNNMDELFSNFHFCKYFVSFPRWRPQNHHCAFIKRFEVWTHSSAMATMPRAHYVCLPPDQNFFWPEYENSCIFRASLARDVLVFLLFYHRKKIPKLGCQSWEIEGGAQVGTLVGLLCLRHGRWQNSDPFAKNYRSCPIRTQNRVTSKLGLLQPRIGL